MISILDLPGEIIAKILRQVDSQTFKNAVYAGLECRQWITKHDRAMHKFDLRKYGPQSWELFARTRGKKKAIHFKYYAAHGVPIWRFNHIIDDLFLTESIGALRYLHSLGLVGDWIHISRIARANKLKSLQFAQEIGLFKQWKLPKGFLVDEFKYWNSETIEFMYKIRQWKLCEPFLEHIFLSVAVDHDRVDIMDFLEKRYDYKRENDWFAAVFSEIKMMQCTQFPKIPVGVLSYQIMMGKCVEYRYLLSLTKFSEEEVWQDTNLDKCKDFLMKCDLQLLKNAVKYDKLHNVPSVEDVEKFIQICCPRKFEIVFNAGKIDKDFRQMFYWCGKYQQIEIFNFLRTKSRGIFRDLEFANGLLKHSSTHCDVVMDILQYLHYGADDWFRKRTIAQNANAKLFNYLVSMNPAYTEVVSERYLPYAIKGENYYMIERIMKTHKCAVPKNIGNISLKMFKFLAARHKN